jgi:hypothetical protein
MAGQTWKVSIQKDNKSGRWVVGKPRGRPNRGVDQMEWMLLPDPDGHAVSAQFQFTDMTLFKNPDGQSDLTPDMTARIPKAGGSLTLALHPDACRRTNPHRYAVWIRDDKLPDGGVYAVGEDLNPPPEISVGP